MIKKIKYNITAPEVMMGPIALRQPLPTTGIKDLDPFLLLHHVGPEHQIAGEQSVMDIGGHPHRGFEPITFIFKGSLHHKDSRGNDSIIHGGGVQWMTAGMGVIHSERASKDFVDQGGDIEIIQLWVNLPSKLKMIQPKYQGLQKEDIPIVENQGVVAQIIAGQFWGQKGPIDSITDIQAMIIHMDPGTKINWEVKEGHKPLLYQLNGEAKVNNQDTQTHKMITFAPEGNKIDIDSVSKSTFLFVSGNPISEPIHQHGPFVMNTQTEILQAMRDYQMGKMGILI